MSQNFIIILFNAKLGSFKLNILLLHTVEYSNFALERKRGLCIKMILWFQSALYLESNVR